MVCRCNYQDLQENSLFLFNSNKRSEHSIDYSFAQVAQVLLQHITHHRFIFF